MPASLAAANRIGSADVRRETPNTIQAMSANPIAASVPQAISSHNA
jgi:hypothetical protein